MMDVSDWLLCIGVTVAVAAAFGLLIPKIGWAAGAVLAIAALVRAKKKRDELSIQKEQPGNDLSRKD